MSRRSAAAVVFALVLVLSAQGARAADAAPDPMRVTANAIRQIGAALWSWGQDQPALPAPAGSTAGEEKPTVRWSACKPLSAAAARKLLVPAYIVDLPVDGWGNALEICLDPGRIRPGEREVMGVRSPGRDGKFEGDSYTTGPFDPQELDRDMVWMDGYFMVWPQKPDAS